MRVLYSNLQVRFGVFVSDNEGLCCLMIPVISVRTFGVLYGYTISKLTNHQIRHQQATHKVGCRPGDCICMVTLIFPRGLCGYVWVNVLTLSPLRVARIGHIQKVKPL